MDKVELRPFHLASSKSSATTPRPVPVCRRTPLSPKRRDSSRNATLRHSYISYRIVTLKDVPAVALECGNSPSVIFSNYRALASEAEGKAWFEVRPEQNAANIITMPASRPSAPQETVSATLGEVVATAVRE